MAINLEKPRTLRATVRKNVGDYLTAAVIDKKEAPRTEYGTGRPMLKDDGTPKKQLVITCLVIDGSKATVGPKDDTRPGAAGEVVNIYLPGWDFGAWIDANKNRQLTVGDVFRWSFTGTEKSTGGSDNDRKVTKFEVRGPKPDEAAQTARCEELYHELRNGGGVSLDEGGASYDADDLEPF